MTNKIQNPLGGAMGVGSALSDDYRVMYYRDMPRAYFENIENTIWNDSLQPILERMKENIFLAGEKHGIAEMYFKQMVENFRRGSEADYNYALKYDGLLTHAQQKAENKKQRVIESLSWL